MRGKDRLIPAVDRIYEIGGMDILGLGVKAVAARKNPSAVPGPQNDIVVQLFLG